MIATDVTTNYIILQLALIQFRFVKISTNEDLPGGNLNLNLNIKAQLIIRILNIVRQKQT